MSSESDDDFQSADEGSDLEEILPPSSAKQDMPQQQVRPEMLFPPDKVGQRQHSPTEKASSTNVVSQPCTEEEVPEVERSPLIGALKNLSLQVSEQLVVPIGDASANADFESNDEESDSKESWESPELKFKAFSGVPVNDDDTLVEERKRMVKKTQVEESKDIVQGDCDEVSALHDHKQVFRNDDKDLKDSVKVENQRSISSENDKVSISGENESLQESICHEEVNLLETKSSSLGEKAFEVKFSELDSVEVLPVVAKDVVPETKQFDNETTSSPPTDLKDQETQRIDEEMRSTDFQSIAPKPVKAKPIRESKLGMKKPREKLGERLGARKLGEKLEKKPMRGISSESHKTKNLSNNSASVNQSEQVENKLPSKAVSDEKELQKSSTRKQDERWQQVHNIDLKKMERQDNSVDGWGTSWGNWGTTLMSAASTLKVEVGRGVGSIMDTVEETLGVPDPETMAREIAEREKKLKAQNIEGVDSNEPKTQPPRDTEDALSRERDEMAAKGAAFGVSQQEEYGLSSFSSFGSLVSGVSGVFESASNKVLMGGLDTLEVIGRRAMDAIQKDDPGLRKKRAFLSNPKPNLSLVLQEARQRAAEEEKRQQQEGGSFGKDGMSSQSCLTFDKIWEISEGCVHLEALSLVGKQCQSKLSSLSQNMPHYAIEKIQASNEEIKNACELEEECTFTGNFITQVEEIIPLTCLPVQSLKITNAWNSLEETISLIREAASVNGPTAEKELYEALVDLVAQFAAVIHKGAELALITPEADPFNVAVQFQELSSVMCGGIENKADEVCGIITTETSAANPKLNNTITNIYLQSANGSNYIKECLSYLASVLQYSNTKQMAVEL